MRERPSRRRCRLLFVESSEIPAEVLFVVAWRRCACASPAYACGGKGCVEIARLRDDSSVFVLDAVSDEQVRRIFHVLPRGHRDRDAVVRLKDFAHCVDERLFSGREKRGYYCHRVRNWRDDAPQRRWKDAEKERELFGKSPWHEPVCAPELQNRRVGLPDCARYAVALRIVRRVAVGERELDAAYAYRVGKRRGRDADLREPLPLVEAEARLLLVRRHAKPFDEVSRRHDFARNRLVEMLDKRVRVEELRTAQSFGALLYLAYQRGVLAY